MIVDSEEIIKNKPKDCKLCPKSLCEAMNTTGILYIYYNYNSTTIYPLCVNNRGFVVLKKTNYFSSIDKTYSSLVEAIDNTIIDPYCELEEALQLTKIKSMINGE